MPLHIVDEIAVAVLWRKRGDYQLASVPVYSLCLLDDFDNTTFTMDNCAGYSQYEGPTYESPPVAVGALPVEGQMGNDDSVRTPGHLRPPPTQIPDQPTDDDM